MTTAAETAGARQGPARGLLRAAALLASLASFAVAVAAVPDLTERLGWPPFVLWTIPLVLLLEYGAARIEHTPNAARAVTKKLGPAMIALLVVLASGLALHPFVPNDTALSVAFGVLGLSLLAAADAVNADGTRARAGVISAYLLAVVGVIGVVAMLAVGDTQPVVLVVLAAVLTAYLVIGYAIRRRAAR